MHFVILSMLIGGYHMCRLQVVPSPIVTCRYASISVGVVQHVVKLTGQKAFVGLAMVL